MCFMNLFIKLFFTCLNVKLACAIQVAVSNGENGDNQSNCEEFWINCLFRFIKCNNNNIILSLLLC